MPRDPPVTIATSPIGVPPGWVTMAITLDGAAGPRTRVYPCPPTGRRVRAGGRTTDAGLQGEGRGAPGARSTAGRRPWCEERRFGHPRRGRDRQDRAAALLRPPGVRLSGGTDRGRGVRDGTSLRRTSPAVR